MIGRHQCSADHGKRGAQHAAFPAGTATKSWATHVAARMSALVLTGPERAFLLTASSRRREVPEPTFGFEVCSSWSGCLPLGPGRRGAAGEVPPQNRLFGPTAGGSEAGLSSGEPQLTVVSCCISYPALALRLALPCVAITNESRRTTTPAIQILVTLALPATVRFVRAQRPSFRFNRAVGRPNFHA